MYITIATVYIFSTFWYLLLTGLQCRRGVYTENISCQQHLLFIQRSIWEEAPVPAGTWHYQSIICLYYQSNCHVWSLLGILSSPVMSKDGLIQTVLLCLGTNLQEIYVLQVAADSWKWKELWCSKTCMKNSVLLLAAWAIVIVYLKFVAIYCIRITLLPSCELQPHMHAVGQL